MEHDKVVALRKVMGTDPAREPTRADKIFVGSEGIRVQLLDFPSDPYRAIYEGAVATWGSSETWWDKYPKTSPEGRLMVILACLSHKTLPIALEGPKFTFQIEGPSRAAFDQMARARIGTGFNSIGTRDNDWLDASMRVPHEIAKDPEQMRMHRDAFYAAKDAYETTVRGKKESWQSARFILPMGTCHSWVVNVNYLALQSMMAQRMKFCEQFDLVGTAWLMANEVKKKYPLLAAFLRPGCDFAGKCQYHSNYNLSELFGALFSGCGRHPVEAGEKYTEFNRACSTSSEIESDLGMPIHIGKNWDETVIDAIQTDPALNMPLMNRETIRDIMNFHR